MSDQIFSDDCQYIIKNSKLNKIKKKKILILGANSFFASYLQAVLSLNGCEITSISLNKPRGIFKNILKEKKIKFMRFNLKNENKLRNVLKKKFDFIFHCATYGQPEKWDKNFFNTIHLNTRVLELILEHSVKYKSSILYLSSAAVYNASKDKKVKNENSKLSTGEFLGENIYSISKILGEKICKFYKEKFNIPVYIARPAHTFGPGQDFKFDHRIMPQLIKRALIEKKIYIYDKGKTVRSWTYISDVVVMLLNIVQYGKQMTYNVCGKEYKSIYQIAKEIAKIQKIKKIQIKNKKLNFTNPNYNILVLSSKRYNKEFSKPKYIRFNDGLKKLIEWNKKWQKLN